MNGGPADRDEPDPTPPSERRHADRVRLHGYAFKTGNAAYRVLDISLGGLRIAYGETEKPAPPGSEMVGVLTGGPARPLTLNTEIVWVDRNARQIGCTFPVLGHNIAGDLLEILL
ncbi:MULTISPECIES: PilZ domain-containing protein [Thalassobaculum]|uniref:PilZ domain-containing protein n=1 Tax=Thalassobaculum litoreum DSM 18839 TaxID=1123362 RepID=A0A8G2BMI3_9PROT|nr:MULTISPECIES: PilZ domain-containing protein [Thalassobaculum]SDG55455.1 PilZ domain-containing protein [Thalassobaculum litoreum DSM 18839]